MNKQQNTDFFEMAHKGLHKSVIKVFTKSHKNHESKILDIGCGNGNMLNTLYHMGYKDLHGCDGYISNDKLTKIAKFTQANLTKSLPYEDNSFDIVLLTEVIEHMENPNALMKEIHRILRPGGRAIISTPNILNIPSRLLFLFTGHFMLFTQGDIRYDKFPGHIAPFLRYIFQEANKEYFEIEAKNYSNRLVPVIGIEIGIQHRLISNSIILSIKKK